MQRRASSPRSNQAPQLSSGSTSTSTSTSTASASASAPTRSLSPMRSLPPPLLQNNLSSNLSNLSNSSLLSISDAADLPSAAFCLRSTTDSLAQLNVNPHSGLSMLDVEVRRKLHGSNILDNGDDQETILAKFIEQFKNPMNMLLLGSAAVSLLIGQVDDAISITLVCCLLTRRFRFAFVQEYRSEKSLEALNTLLPHYCKVVRNSTQIKILAEELVPGDICHFSAGDRIPADIRLITENHLELDESSLTGETHPRRKHVNVINANIAPPLAERDNIAFMGTLVRNGNCSGVVVGTGKRTEFGHVFEMMKEVENKKTPLQVSMDELGKQLSFLSFLLIFVIVLIGVYQGRPMLEMFTIGVSLAVAAIPEGLPIVVTVTLALGVLRMASRNAIIKKLPSVESLGSVNVICVDKTGTLTTNKQTVTRYLVDVNNATQFGRVTETSAFKQLMKIAMICNNARIDNTRESIGQPTEVALLDLATTKLGMEDARLHHQRLSEIPFTSDRKCMTVTARSVNAPQHSTPQIYMKGSMESVLDRCTRYYVSDSDPVMVLDSGTREKVRLLHDEAAMRGYGASFCDGTASSIAREIGIPINNKMQSMMGGNQLDNVNERDLEEVIDNVNVFYRVTPKHKMLIVRALQSKGYNVAMTGDGVNDAPALRLADIGISMGKTTILYAIEEGKSIFYNIQNFLRFQLSTSISALTLVAASTVLGFANPFNAMQILWINIICDGPVAQSLGVELVDPDIMKKPPEQRTTDCNETIYNSRTCSAFCIVTGTLYVYRGEVVAGSAESRTFTCFVLFDMFNSMACRSVSRSIFSIGPFTNQMLNIAISLCLLGQLLVIYMPFFQSIFQTEALSLYDLLYLIVLTSSVLWVDEWRK
ncbi:calcium-transporting P [Rhizoclosmatium globosum]|uniref:P-type Ca(2+) transporter n=1 Tax=Rhizoclosmatium globosum TaxID=329046 RepID=A0A1Y2CMB5_9FUNG|nr:calcium-transporting P [Rhizoclosmatium globosum]|eukprot:ORY48171.1 calcium-transporting P [Rhizoclosmatium globosum]